MKPLAAHACARPLTAPSTMTLLEQPNRARCAINCRIHCSLMERARSRSSAGYCPATLPLDSLVGSLAARPIASIGRLKGSSGRCQSARRYERRTDLQFGSEMAMLAWSGCPQPFPSRRDREFEIRLSPARSQLRT